MTALISYGLSWPYKVNDVTANPFPFVYRTGRGFLSTLKEMARSMEILGARRTEKLLPNDTGMLGILKDGEAAVEMLRMPKEQRSWRACRECD